MWRPGVFVAHLGGQSFGAARNHLMERNLAVLNRLHPGYNQLIAAIRRPIRWPRPAGGSTWRAGAPHAAAPRGVSRAAMARLRARSC